MTLDRLRNRIGFRTPRGHDSWPARDEEGAAVTVGYEFNNSGWIGCFGYHERDANANQELGR